MCNRNFLAITVSLLLSAAYPCRIRADNSSPSNIGEANRPVIQEVWNILHLLEQEPMPEQEEIVRKLAALGSDAVPTLFGILTWTWGYGIETDIGQYLNTNKPYDDAAVSPDLLAQHEQALFKALIRMRDDGLVSYLQTLVSSEAPSGFRITAGRIVKTIAMDDQDVLHNMLGVNPSMDITLIAHIEEIADASPKGLKKRTLNKLRRFLNHRDWPVRRAAAKTLGELRDVGSVPRLIELLKDEKKGVRTNALRSLKNISGLPFSEDQSRWSRWFERETAWLENESSEVIEKLGSRSDAEVIAAIHSISQKRIFRDEMADELGEILRHKTPVIRRAGCMGLQQLGSKRATEPLVKALEDSDIGVRRAAWAALKSITHQKLPSDYKAWKAWLKDV